MLNLDIHILIHALRGFPTISTSVATPPPGIRLLIIYTVGGRTTARRPLPIRFRFAFIHTYKPALDDEPFRAFDTTADYRRWCEEDLPDWLGYGRV